MGLRRACWTLLLGAAVGLTATLAATPSDAAELAATPSGAAELPATIRVTGSATVSAPPDQAVIDIGIESESEDADRAASQNAEKVNAVLSALRRALGSDADEKLQTISYSLSPRYAPYQQGSPQRIDGYTATNVVRVESDDLEAVGRLIDVSIKAGANRVQQLSFGLKDDQPLRAQALREATLRARQRADAIASALSQSIVGVLSVEEGLGSPTPIYSRQAQMMQARAAESSTEVLPGSIEVRESVTYTVEIGP